LFVFAKLGGRDAEVPFEQAFALPRFGGERFPSELVNLKWSDVNWQDSTFKVYEPKVEHHSGRGVRVGPIFAALRPHLERAYAEREEGAVDRRNPGTISSRRRFTNLPEKRLAS
jgi:integrase